MSKVAILFKGSTCVPCKAFEPAFETILEDYPEVELVKETDNVVLMRAYGVRTVPAVVLADKVQDNLIVRKSLAGSELRSASVRASVETFARLKVGENGEFGKLA